MGILSALAQADLKRLLAYSSIENIGIITMGLGLGVLGMATHSPTLGVLGFAGALLHVINHALFKGLLFLGAGVVEQSTGTRELDRLGGLLKRMPWTGSAFLDRLGGHRRSAAAQRFCQRVLALQRLVRQRRIVGALARRRSFRWP